MRRLLIVFLLAALPLSAADKDSYHGFDLDQLAEAMAHMTTLRTQFGEKPGYVKFDEWLQKQGKSAAAYERAYSAWWTRFEADHTGQLHARFSRINAEYVQQLNFADTKDRRAEVKEGVSLDKYAQIVVALTRKNASLDDVLKKYGVKDKAQWQRVNVAWTDAMKADTSFALIQQYGALYQKYAGEDFAKQMEQTVAKSLAEHQANSERPAPAPRTAPDIAEIAGRMASAQKLNERWDAAREYAWQCGLWSGPARRKAADPRAAYCDAKTLNEKLLPVMLDAIDHFDDKGVHYGTMFLNYLDDLDLKTSSAKSAVARALNRSESRLAELNAAFAPIQDKAVPERIILRSRIDDYTGAVQQLRAALATW